MSLTLEQTERELAERDWLVIQQAGMAGLARDRRYIGLEVRELVARLIAERRGQAPEWAPGQGATPTPAELLEVVGVEVDQDLAHRWDANDYERRQLGRGRRDLALLDSGPLDLHANIVDVNDWALVGDQGALGLIAERRRFRENAIRRVLAALHKARKGWYREGQFWSREQVAAGEVEIEGVQKALAEQLVFPGGPAPLVTWMRALGLVEAPGGKPA